MTTTYLSRRLVTLASSLSALISTIQQAEQHALASPTRQLTLADWQHISKSAKQSQDLMFNMMREDLNQSPGDEYDLSAKLAASLKFEGKGTVNQQPPGTMLKLIESAFQEHIKPEPEAPKLKMMPLDPTPKPLKMAKVHWQADE